MAEKAPIEVKELVKQHEFLDFTEFGKVHCKITDHDLPAKIDLISAHLVGEKFRKQKEW